MVERKTIISVKNIFSQKVDYKKTELVPKILSTSEFARLRRSGSELLQFSVVKETKSVPRGRFDSCVASQNKSVAG